MLPNKPDGETDVVVHMKEIGNKEYKNIKKDTLIGTTGQNRRLEAIRITGHALHLEAIRINPYGKTIKAKVHIQSKGWVDYGMITKDTIIGTVGERNVSNAYALKVTLNIVFIYRVPDGQIGQKQTE